MAAADSQPDPTDQLVVDVFARACPSRALLETVTGKWSVLVLVALAEGPHRFGELRRRVDGVSEKMLSQALHELEAQRLVTRTDHGTRPPRVDYALTPAGVTVAERLTALVEVLEQTISAAAKP